MELYKLLITVQLLSLFLAGRAREYFVSTDGDDSNPGTFLGNMYKRPPQFWPQEMYVHSGAEFTMKK